MKFRLLLLSLMVAFSAVIAPQIAQATIVSVPISGTHSVGLQLTPDLLTIIASDFRANGNLSVFDDSVPVLLANVFATDAGAPFPNSAWGIANLGLSEFGVLSFNTSTISIVGGTLTVLGDFAPATGLTDPGLLALVGEQLATFQLVQVVPVGGFIVAVYNLDNLTSVSSAVPEPATAAIFGSGLLLIGAFRLSRKRS